MLIRRIRSWFVRRIYADHNSSPEVVRALGCALRDLGPTGVGINLGAGPSRVHERICNVDLLALPTTDVVADAAELPFASGVVDLVVTQETLEHVRHPQQAVAELWRVLRVGGLLYCQVPFVIGYHPGPTDYWRFTVEGIEALVADSGFEVKEVGVAVGGAVGYYRVSVEFWTAMFSFGGILWYRPVKAFVALCLFPLKWLDRCFRNAKERDRIAGGYFVLAVKEDRRRTPSAAHGRGLKEPNPTRDHPIGD